MTRAAEPMTREVIVVSPDLPLDAAWQLMMRERFRHLPVVSNGVLVGMLSDRDILIRATREHDAWTVPSTPVGEAATPWPYVCTPSTDVQDIVRIMLDKRIDSVPVVEGSNRMVGLVTTTDLLKLLLRKDEARLPIPFQFELKEHAVAAA